MKDDFDLSSLVGNKKKRLNSKAKGNRFERKIADLLNKRFNTTDFCRSPGSGAFATTHKLPEYLKVYGDLITPKDFKYIIECKSGYNKERVSDLFNSKSKLLSMIAQATRDSKASSKNFIVVIAQDRADPIVIGNLTGFVEDSKWTGFDHIEYNLNSNYSLLRICRLEDLLTLSDSYFFVQK